jgi:hypothetical protein
VKKEFFYNRPKKEISSLVEGRREKGPVENYFSGFNAQAGMKLAYSWG